ncbi:MAG: hypothetical protein HUN04_21000 [Desulfobacter sp.]|nr:MAG: hypothetical protein HUN04_21000 [Desulfobacter sp.]
MPRSMSQDQTAVVFSPQGPPLVLPMTAMPGIPGLFAKLIALSVVRPSDLPPDISIKNAVMTFDNYAMDPENLDGFKRVCGYPTDSDTVPAPFIQTLFIGMVSKFIGTGYFPITPMGLIQVGQSFERFAPVTAETRLDLSCRLLDMTRTDRGIHTRIRMEARAAGAGKDARPLWQGTSLYFTRAKHPGPKTKKQIEDTPLPVKETIDIPSDTGRRYAAVSRDFNPHHLYGWTAKLIGFKQPIAHGMWSLARTCALLETALGRPGRYRVDGQFKLPIFMPAAVTLGYETREAEEDTAGEQPPLKGVNQVTAFELRDQKQGIPHLKGKFRC